MKKVLISIRMDENLKQRLKEGAVKKKKTIKWVIESLILEWLKESEKKD